MKTPRELLVAAREVIAAPERWCQHAAARTANNSAVTCGDVDAVKWCMSGALSLVGVPDFAQKKMPLETLTAHSRAWEAATLHLERAVREIRREQGLRPYPVIAFNDLAEDHAEVLTAYDRAIECAEATEREAAA